MEPREIDLLISKETKYALFRKLESGYDDPVEAYEFFYNTLNGSAVALIDFLKRVE